MNRIDVLALAADCVTRDRAAQHGDAARNFGLIARYWTAHLGYPVTAQDVPVMMTLLKLARIKSGSGNADSGSGNADNWVDGCGYLALGGELSTSPPVPSGRAE